MLLSPRLGSAALATRSMLARQLLIAVPFSDALVTNIQDFTTVFSGRQPVGPRMQQDGGFLLCYGFLIKQANFRLRIFY